MLNALFVILDDVFVLLGVLAFGFFCLYLMGEWCGERNEGCGEGGEGEKSGVSRREGLCLTTRCACPLTSLLFFSPSPVSPTQSCP
jgi:hypothetical protein